LCWFEPQFENDLSDKLYFVLFLRTDFQWLESIFKINFIFSGSEGSTRGIKKGFGFEEEIKIFFSFFKLRILKRD